MFEIETFASCPTTPVTQIKDSGPNIISINAGCLVITVTENKAKL